MYSLLYKRIQTLLGALCISYILGYCVNILSYFLLVPIGLLELVPAFVIILAIISVFIIAKNSIEVKSINGKIEIVYWLGFFCVLGLSTIAYSAANVSPALNGATWMPTDLLFWIENSAILAGGFPANNPRLLVDDPLFYHYFSSIQIAFLNLASGVDCFTLSVPFYSIGKALVFYGAVYVLICGITQNNLFRLLGVLVFIFSSTLEYVTFSTYVSHIWTHPFGFDIGFAFGAFFLHCFYLQLEKDSLDIRVLILSLISIAICSGAKMPVAVIVIAAAGIVCFSWLFKKQFKLAFGYGCSLLLVFIVIAVFCAGVGMGTAESRVGGFTLWTTIRDESAFLTQIYNQFPGKKPDLIMLPIMIFVYFMCAGCLTYSSAFLAGPVFLFDKPMRTPRNIGLFFAAVLGMGLGIFNIQPGHSQMYFTESAVLPCILIGIVLLDHALPRWTVGEKAIVSILVSSGLILQMFCFMYHSYTYWGAGARFAITRGFTNIISTECTVQPDRIDGLQSADLEALEWIRDNTPKDSVILTDRSVVTGLNAYMFYGAFSERQMYLEGDVYCRDTFVEERQRLRNIVFGVYQNSGELLQCAIDDGVDYIVQTVSLTPSFVADESKLTLVYSSDTINVYEVKK